MQKNEKKINAIIRTDISEYSLFCTKADLFSNGC